MDDRVFCRKRGRALGGSQGPCPQCGCTTRVYDERGRTQSLTVWVGARRKHRRLGFRFGRGKRAVAEGHVRYEASQHADLARNEQLIERDRRRARWRFCERGRKFHRVTDAVTGRVIHQHDGPLQTWGWVRAVRQGAGRQLARLVRCLLEVRSRHRRSDRP